MLRFVDLLKVSVEDLDETERHVLDLAGVAENIHEEELLLLFREDVLLSLHQLVSVKMLLVREPAAHGLEALLVDPVEELGLVLVEVGLSDEELPKVLDVVDADAHEFVGARAVVLGL